jgi:hypothetical protein
MLKIPPCFRFSLLQPSFPKAAFSCILFYLTRARLSIEKTRRGPFFAYFSAKKSTASESKKDAPVEGGIFSISAKSTSGK